MSVTHSFTYLLILEHTKTSYTLVTFETFDQSDEKTWPDQQKDNDKGNYEYIKRTQSNEVGLRELYVAAFRWKFAISELLELTTK